MLIGVDLDPNLSVNGSLATILRLVALLRERQEMALSHHRNRRCFAGLGSADEKHSGEGAGESVALEPRFVSADRRFFGCLGALSTTPAADSLRH
jgi:hypothetical protein